MFSSSIDSIETAKFLCGCNACSGQGSVVLGAIRQDVHVCISSTMFKLLFRYDLNHYPLSCNRSAEKALK